MNIIENELYPPKFISNEGWILDTRGKKNYPYILKLIHKGVLKSINKGTGKIPYHMIRGSEIKRYLREIEGAKI